MPRPEGGRFPATSSPPSRYGRRLSGVVSVDWFCVVPSQQLHLRGSDDADRFLKLSKPCGCTVSTMGLSEARGLVLFRVIRGGIGVTQRLGATGTVSTTGHCHTHPRTRTSPNRLATTSKIHWRWNGLFTGDAQAACDFSFSASKFSPFFQRVNVIAAILRASVRRAIVGLMPFASAA